VVDGLDGGCADLHDLEHVDCEGEGIHHGEEKGNMSRREAGLGSETSCSK
jgi:hypothetical protein